MAGYPQPSRGAIPSGEFSRRPSAGGSRETARAGSGPAVPSAERADGKARQRNANLCGGEEGPAESGGTPGNAGGERRRPDGKRRGGPVHGGGGETAHRHP